MRDEKEMGASGEKYRASFFYHRALRPKTSRQPRENTASAFFIDRKNSPVSAKKHDTLPGEPRDQKSGFTPDQRSIGSAGRGYDRSSTYCKNAAAFTVWIECHDSCLVCL